jgi:hypothetical protein
MFRVYTCKHRHRNLHQRGTKSKLQTLYLKVKGDGNVGRKKENNEEETYTKEVKGDGEAGKKRRDECQLEIYGYHQCLLS